MAIAIRGTTPLVVATTANPISGTLTGTRQPQTGDLLVIIHGNDYYALSNMPTPTVGGSTAGVNPITSGAADGGSLFAHAKGYTYAVGSTGDLVVSVTETGTGDEEKCLVVYVLSGADTSTPTDGANNNADSTGTTTNRVCNAVSPSSSDAFLIVHTNDGNGSNSVSYTPPSGMSEQYDGSLAASMGYSGATLQLSSSGSTGTKTFVAAGNASYCTLTIAVKTAAAAAAVPYSSQRTVVTRDVGETWWVQRDRRNANLVATAANDLAPPLTVAEHSRQVYGHGAYRDRRLVPQQRTYYDLSLLAPAVAAVTPAPPRTVPARDYGEAQWLQPARRDPLPLTSALLENELLGGAETAKRTNVAATHTDRRNVPQQRIYFDLTLLATALLETPLLWVRPQPVIADRREMPQQRPYICDPSLLTSVAADVPPADVWRRFLPATHADRRGPPLQPPRQTLYFDAGPDSPPLTLAWGAGGSLWHRYNPRRPDRWWPVVVRAGADLAVIVPGVFASTAAGAVLSAASSAGQRAHESTSTLSATSGTGSTRRSSTSSLDATNGP